MKRSQDLATLAEKQSKTAQEAPALQNSRFIDSSQNIIQQERSKETFLHLGKDLETQSDIQVIQGKPSRIMSEDQTLAYSPYKQLNFSPNHQFTGQQSDTDRPSRGVYKLQQSLDSGFARQMSNLQNPSKRQITKISNLIDKHHAMRLMKPYANLDLLSPPKNQLNNFQAFQIRSNSRYEAKLRAVAAFESSKFQSYTNFDPSTSVQSNKNILKINMKADSLEPKDPQIEANNFQLFERSVEADSILQQSHENRSIQFSQQRRVDKNQLDDTVDKIMNSYSQDNSTEFKQMPTESNVILKQPISPKAAAQNQLWGLNQKMKGKIDIPDQRNHERQLSTGRQHMQKLPFIPPGTPFGPQSITRRSQQRSSIGRNFAFRESVTTPLRNSKVLANQAAGVKVNVGDYGSIPSHLPELGRSMNNATFRQKSTQFPQSSGAAPNCLLKTPREQKLGVLQLAMWQRVQKRSNIRPQDGKHVAFEDIDTGRPTQISNTGKTVSTNFADGASIEPNSLLTVDYQKIQKQVKSDRESLKNVLSDPNSRNINQLSKQKSSQRRRESQASNLKVSEQRNSQLGSKIRKTEESSSGSSYSLEDEALMAQALNQQNFQGSFKVQIGPRDIDQGDQNEAKSPSIIRQVTTPESRLLFNNLGDKLLKSVQEKWHEAQKQRREEKRRQSKLQVDPVTGLNLNNYLMRKGFKKMVKLLETLTKERRANDLIEQTLKDVAIGCKLDLSQEGLQDIVHQIKNLIARRVRQKREEERGLAGYIPDDCCKVALKSQLFLNSTKTASSSPPRKYQDIISAAANHGHHDCKHHQGEDDIEQECIELYQKLMQFRSRLQHKLKQELPKDYIAKGILENIKQDTQQDKEHLELFKNEKNISKLLSDPYMDIIESNEVKQKEQAILEQGSPQKQRNQAKISISIQGPVLYETKNQQTVSLSARKQINEVQQLIKRDREQSLNQNQAQESDTEKNKDLTNEEKAIEQRRRQARKLLMAGKKEKPQVKQTQNFLNMNDLIQGNKLRDEQLAAYDPNSEESAIIQKRMASKLVPNLQTIYRLNMVQKMQEKEIEESMQMSKVQHKLVDLETFDEDELNNRKYRLSGHDEAFSSKLNEFIDSSEIYQKLMKQIDNLIRPINSRPNSIAQSRNEQKITNANSQNQDILSQKSNDNEDRSYQQNLLTDMDATDKFYTKAKQEIAGNNQPPTLESQFYVNCQEQRLLAYPIFKSVNNNTMNFHGQSLSLGYCKAFASLIMNNVEPSDHLLSMHLDDCNMKDEELSVLLDAIQNSKHFYTSIQSIKYSNNEMGLLSVQKLASLMSIDHGISSFHKDIYCLKELTLSNVSFKKEEELRSLLEMLAGDSGQYLQKLKLHKINLNPGDFLTQQEMLKNICLLIETSLKLRSLSLSQCNLGAKCLFRDENGKLILNTSFLKLFDSLMLNQSHLTDLDLSDNPISVQIPNRNETVTQIAQKIKLLIEVKTSLRSLNLSGLRLTSALTIIVPSVKENVTLSYLNISSNSLLPFDQEYILRELSVGMMHSCNVIPSQQLLLQIDSCFNKALNEFKSAHLKDSFIKKMCSDPSSGNATQGLKTDSIDTQTDEYEQQELYANMVNSAIMKRVHENNNLDRKINFTAELVGEKLLRTTQLGSKAEVDSIILHRESRNPEFIFNQLRTCNKQSTIKNQGQTTASQHCDYGLPLSWKLLQDGDIDCNNSSWQFSQNAQYVSICIDKSKVASHFAPVFDQKVYQIFNKFYGLDLISAKSPDPNTKESTNCFLIFGTFTEWKIYHMLKLYKMTAAMVATNQSDYKALEDDVFDETNNNLRQTFKAIQSAAWGAFQALLKNEHAQSIGLTDIEFQSLNRRDKENLIQDRCMTFNTLVRRTGKHSIFIYDIAKKQLYFKLVVIEQSLPWLFCGGRWSPIFHSVCQSPFDSANIQISTSLTQKQQDFSHNDHKQFGFQSNKDHRKMITKLAFLNDINPSHLQISSFFKKESDLRDTFEILNQRYEHLMTLFQHLVSNSPEEYPRLSLASLIDFIKLKTQPPQEEEQEEGAQENAAEEKVKQAPTGKQGSNITSKIPDLDNLNDLKQFAKADRAIFIRFLFWLWKFGYQHQCWPASFKKYIDEVILSDKSDYDYWSVKETLRLDDEIQTFVEANVEALLQFMRVCSTYKGFYIGFSHNIAKQILIAGELDALKPDPVKKQEPKKKKGKKGAKKAEPQPAAETVKKKPPVETVQISLENMNKCFYQSLQILVPEQSESDGMQNTIKSVDELVEFLYRVSQIVFDITNYDEPKKVPKSISALFEASSVQKLQKLLQILMKIVELNIPLVECE